MYPHMEAKEVANCFWTQKGGEFGGNKKGEHSSLL